MSRSAFERLTPRERECLRLLAQHLSSKEIAKRLPLSPKTVDSYLDDARKRLGAPTRREAARLFADYELAYPRDLTGPTSDRVSDRPTPPTPSAPALGEVDERSQTEGGHVRTADAAFHVGRTGESPSGAGGERRSEGHRASLDLGSSKAGSISSTGDGAEGARAPFVADPGRVLERSGRGTRRVHLTPIQRLGAIVVIAIVSGLMLTGALIAADGFLNAIHRVAPP